MGDPWHEPPSTEPDPLDSRVCNHDEAVRAFEQGMIFLEMKEYERAMRLLRRSFVLEAAPQTASLMHRARQEIQADTRYCSTCYRFNMNCECGQPASSAHSDRGHEHGVAPLVQLPRLWNYFCEQVDRLIRWLGVATDDITMIRVLFLTIVVVAVLRAMYGAPLWHLLAPAPVRETSPMSTVQDVELGSSFLSTSIFQSIALTIGINVILRLVARRH
jgi:hypothetical protein